MMHAVRRACAGVLKGSKAFPSPLAQNTAVNSLPSCLITREYILESCRFAFLVDFNLTGCRSSFSDHDGTSLTCFLFDLNRLLAKFDNKTAFFLHSYLDCRYVFKRVSLLVVLILYRKLTLRKFHCFGSGWGIKSDIDKKRRVSGKF